jgi:hypothetical protein
MQPNRTATDYPAESVFPQFAPRTSTHFFMLSMLLSLGGIILFSRARTPKRENHVAVQAKSSPSRAWVDVLQAAVTD